jgi:hypothetical protein
VDGQAFNVRSAGPSVAEHKIGICVDMSDMKRRDEPSRLDRDPPLGKELGVFSVTKPGRRSLSPQRSWRKV